MSGTTTTPATDGRSPAHADARGIRSPRTERGLGSPGLLRLGTSRIGYETKGYFRSPDAVFFTFLFPLIMLGIFTAAFSASGDIGPARGRRASRSGAYYLPGMLAAGMLLSGVQNLAVDIATEKSDGTLKRLGGTPLSPVAYFLGKIGQVLRHRHPAGGAAAARRRHSCSASQLPTDARGVAHVRLGVRARRHHLGALRHRALGGSPLAARARPPS